jgi:hypothetical protein
MNFTTATSSILAGLQYVPYVSQAMQSVEATNASLPGATKKQIVLASVQAAAKVGEQIPEAHVQLIATLIDLLAGIFNSTGLFANKAKPAPVAA